MDQEKIGKFILNLRKKNNLTQKELADKLGVTYQAVSKWETGKNIPDIAILKDMAKLFDIDINQLLGDEDHQDKKDSNNKNGILAIIVIVIITGLVIFIQLNYKDTNNFQLKTIESNCDDFNISGSVAYNSNRSSIYISDVNYCGPNEEIEYDNIECSLYEIENGREIKIEDCSYVNKEKITLNNYLKHIKFNIDDYSTICKENGTNELKIEIKAKKNGELTKFNIPLNIKDNCKK